jgi:hypothetical protein
MKVALIAVVVTSIGAPLANADAQEQRLPIIDSA